MARAFPFRTRDGRAGVIREARPRDARACLAIVAEAAAERPRTLSLLEEELWPVRVWRRHRRDWGPDGVSLVAEVGGVPVGQLSCDRVPRRTGRHGAEFGVTVAARARGLGVGRALLQTLEVWAAEYRVSRITLGVFAGNERARALYRSMGYEDEGVERGGVRFPEGSVDVVRMAKLLGMEGGGSQATMDASGETREG